MDYIKAIENIEKYINENMDILHFLYPREFECKYSSIIKCIKNGNNLEELKKEIETFYRFQGMDNEKRINLLKLFDNEKDNIKNVDNSNINELFNLYNTLLKKTIKITGKCQYVNTAKLMNLYNQNIPLFDNNVINFLKYLNLPIENRTKEAYLHLLNIYKLINEHKNIPNILKLKNKIYSDMEIEYINLNKFVDTLFYFINDTDNIEKYKKLCKNKKGQTSA